MSGTTNGWKSKLVAGLVAAMMIALGVLARIAIGRMELLEAADRRHIQAIGEATAQRTELERRVLDLEGRARELEQRTAVHGAFLDRIEKEPPNGQGVRWQRSKER